MFTRGYTKENVMVRLKICMHVWSKEQESSDMKIGNRKLVQILLLQISLLISLFISIFLWEDIDNYPKALQPMKKTDDCFHLLYEIFCGTR